MLAGILLGLGASAAWSLANVAIQRAGRAVGPWQGLVWAQLVGIGLAIGVGMALGERPGAVTAADAGWIALAGVAGLGGYLCLFYAFEHGRLTLAVPIMSSWAVLSAAISLIVFRERLTVGQLAGAASVVAGAVVVARHAHRSEGGDSGGTRRWLPAALGAALGFGVLIPAMRRLSPVFGPVQTIAVVYAADLVLLVPLAAVLRIRLSPPPGAAWPAIALSGLFETVGSACVTLGALHAPLAVVSPLASLAAAFTVVYAWAVLRERPARGVLVGAALVSAGVVVLAL